MPELNVVDTQGKKAAKIDLPDGKFGVAVNGAVIHQAVVMYNANRRAGTASTKTRKDVSGGGKKPWAQKGTGRSRQGSSRSPLWKKGGIIFGPHPRDFGYTISRKAKAGALRESLNAKFVGNHLWCIDGLAVPSGKTKDFAAILRVLNLEGRTLAVLDGADEKTLRASRNIPRLTVVRALDANASDIMNNKDVLLTKEALTTLLKRIL
ncbi:MAG: 50S ribosomal protein L4 [Candidatus Omnitrophica bacterium]|nr:50S ribosomal protein L4 [Candidatus Omnitrophota bacterium]MDE2008522.1 50S ribosomal protein L4 [Candidatus Omnitrophota bacterium]MDE2213988.1 50S ribosomal protein L4 [Candidatus Omnitrophota bacterium]MDE2231357.1 50S ribosomal protein L4 [Candidatus Omnitrophota bacterium]